MKLRPTLYLHLGMHKTGTTSIQYALHQWRAPLLAEEGILYPLTGCAPSSPRQHLLVVLAYAASMELDDPYVPSAPIDRDVLIPALRHEIEVSGAQEVVLSSEEFWWRSEIIDRLPEDFADFDIVPIVFLRDYAEVVEGSMYSSAVYGGNPQADPSELYLAGCFASLFERWASIAASGRITLVAYGQHQGKDSVRQFLDLLDVREELRITIAASAARQNVSTNLLEVVIRRLLPADADPAALRALETVVKRLPKQRSVSILRPHVRNALKQKFAADMEALLKAPFVDGLAFDAGAYWQGQRPVEHVNGLLDVLQVIAQAHTVEPRPAACR